MILSPTTAEIAPHLISTHNSFTSLFFFVLLGLLRFYFSSIRTHTQIAINTRFLFRLGKGPFVLLKLTQRQQLGEGQRMDLKGGEWDKTNTEYMKKGRGCQSLVWMGSRLGSPQEFQGNK